MDTVSQRFVPAHKIRIVTATSLFDGHDASINVMRRILQASGAEIIHLGHNRSVAEIVNAAIQEDAHAIAVSSYQGGHIEFFKYMVDMLRERGRADIGVFGGGGGVIVPAEIAELHAYGVARIYSPQDGQALGLQGMIDDILARSDRDVTASQPFDPDGLKAGDHAALARVVSALELGTLPPAIKAALEEGKKIETPILGITGTGGAGKSSLNDELISRFRLDFGEKVKIAVLAIDPTRRRTGGALLGDRIRMNAIDHSNIFVRSLATRGAQVEVPDCIDSVVAAVKLAGFDFIVIETPGVGQGASDLPRHTDATLYVMTPEFGAASQLEKIDMLDFADFVAINKFDRKGAEDALRDVRKQVQRNREAFSQSPEAMPVFGTIASRFNDDGVTALYCAIKERMGFGSGALEKPASKVSSKAHAIVPPSRIRYLADIAATVRAHHREGEAQAQAAHRLQALSLAEKESGAAEALAPAIEKAKAALSSESRALLSGWPALKAEVRADVHFATSLSGSPIPKIAVPDYMSDGDLLRFLKKENLPGYFPYTAGVFPFRRVGEDPARLFAGEGDAAQTNRRFRMLSEHSDAKRLSTAFDSVTLYGCDPAERPDIYGKIGNSGVSIATLDDMKTLYDGFDLCDPKTSVSMTINGPAPTVLAFFLNTAIDQEMAKFEAATGRAPEPEEAKRIKADALSKVRGTVQADILKEDQGQNTCIFSTEFSLKMMGDIQAYFVENNVRNFYSVSISGYHIAEAGANPISQLAFTLANGFTYVEAYLARGLEIDDFAPNLSFFFSNGMDPEYSVIGRVARRIWAVAMRDRYGANARSQKLKYHVQTSGRSLHAQEMSFNDIRTTLQALIALYDNCNSLHTNAYDEAITTPTEESVRRALAIQLVINREWGLSKNENPNQGSFIIEELTDLVEEAVLKEFERISERGGVLGAMETGYQRGKIQDESLTYEHLKHSGELPIIGVNTFRNPAGEAIPAEIELARSADATKDACLERLSAFHARHRNDAPAALEALQNAVLADANVFAVLMDAARVCSLGQISDAFSRVGGRFRRHM